MMIRTFLNSIPVADMIEKELKRAGIEAGETSLGSKIT